MAATDLVSFEHASRYERDLNDRQRDVLRLIAAGSTNGEIAEKLGLTLAGAKWNVSEILSKLGLDSREQAAAYYRWRHRRQLPLSRVGHAFAGFFSWKAGVASASLVVVAAGVLAVWAVVAGAQARDTGPTEPGLAFYLEATLMREDDQHTAAQSVRLSFDDDRHGREEDDSPKVTARKPGFVIEYGEGTGVVVRDGTSQWRMGGGGFYFRDDLDDPRTPPLGIARRVGPVRAPRLDALLAEPTLLGYDWMKVTGKARILGRNVVVLEVGRVDSAVAGLPRVTTGRLWIDPERMFLMRSESVGGPIRESARVTLLRYGEDQPDRLFVFTPVPGAVEMTCKAPASVSPTEFVPSGFINLATAVIPAGFGFVNFGISAAPDGSCGSVKATLIPVPPNAADSRRIEVNESLENPASLFLSPTADHAMADGTPAYAGIDDKGFLALAWMEGKLGMQVASNFLTIAELLSFGNAVVAEHDASSQPPTATPQP